MATQAPQPKQISRSTFGSGSNRSIHKKAGTTIPSGRTAKTTPQARLVRPVCDPMNSSMNASPTANSEMTRPANSQVLVKPRRVWTTRGWARAGAAVETIRAVTPWGGRAVLVPVGPA